MEGGRETEMEKNRLEIQFALVGMSRMPLQALNFELSAMSDVRHCY